MSLPVLTPEQRAESLQKAAASRRARSELKQQLKRGTLSVAEVITDPDEIAGGIKVSALLKALPGVGGVRAAQLMQRIGISENRKVRGLGDRQRDALQAEFPSVAAA